MLFCEALESGLGIATILCFIYNVVMMILMMMMPIVEEGISCISHIVTVPLRGPHIVRDKYPLHEIIITNLP